MGMTEDLTNLVVVNLETGVKEKITVYQYDTARCIVFQFINGTEILNLTGKIARIYMNKPDGELIFNDLETVSEEEGKASILLDENMLAVTGTMYCDITIYEGDKTISIPKFCINIMKPLRNDRSITSTAEYRALTDALANVDDFKTKVDNYNTFLQELGTASPKGAFSSLDDLKVAYPLGDSSVYLVDVDGEYYVAIYEDGEWRTKFPYLTDDVNTVVTDLNERFDNAINAITTDTEVIDARYDSENGITYTTLSDRLVALYNYIQSATGTTTKTRQFKPRFTTTIWTQNTIDSNGDRTVSLDAATLDNEINNLNTCGFDGVILCMHIGYSSTNNDLYYQTNLSTFDYIISKGVNVQMIKFHEEFTIDNIKAMGVDTFKSRYSEMITEVATRYVSNNIPYFTVINENENFWVSNKFTTDADLPNDFLDFTIRLLNIVKAKGYKAGVSTAGFNQVKSTNSWSSAWSVDKSVYDVVDFFATNGYPPVGIKGSSTTKEDVVNAISNYGIWKFRTWINDNYPGKPHFHTEIGCLDNWECLFAPGDSAITGNSTNGEIYKVYLAGILEAFKDSDLIGVNWWYSDSLFNYTSIALSVIKSYTEGDDI